MSAAQPPKLCLYPDRIAVTIDTCTAEAGNGVVVPPEATRFKPGRSGNPNGRPKGAATSLDRILEQELERLVEGDASLGDEGPITRRAPPGASLARRDRAR